MRESLSWHMNTYWLLRFEYVCHGSLDKHIAGRIDETSILIFIFLIYYLLHIMFMDYEVRQNITWSFCVQMHLMDLIGGSDLE